MSIFKKIKSIDPEEHEIISSLGLKPLNFDDDDLAAEDDSLGSEASTKAEPLQEITPEIMPDETHPEDNPTKEAVLSKISNIDLEDTTDKNWDIVDEKITKSEDILNLDQAEPDSQKSAAIVAAPLARSEWLDAQHRPQKTKLDPVPDFITRDVGSGPRSQGNMEPPSFRWTGWVIALSAFLWLIISSAVIYGYFDLGLNWNRMKPMEMAGLALLVLFPIFFILISGYAFKQLAKISTQANELAQAAQDLSQPDVSVVSKTAIMSAAVKQEIERVDSQIDVSLSRMRTLEATLKNQTDSIATTYNHTDNVAEKIAQSLSEQRVGLENMADIFDDRMAALNRALKSQLNGLESASNLSEQKIDEARIGIEGASAKVSAAADFLRAQSLEVTSSIVDNNSEIERLGLLTTERATELEKIYAKYATEITEMIESLRDEQENLGLTLETRLKNMRDVALSAKTSAESLTKASLSGQQTVTALADAARLTDSAVKQRFAEMEDMVKYSNAKAESLSQSATRRVQTSLANTRKEIARIENDMATLQTRLDVSAKDGHQTNLDKHSQSIAASAPAGEPAEPTKASSSKSTGRKKTGRLKLKPVEEDFPPVIPPRNADIESQTTPDANKENIPQYDDLDALNDLDLNVEKVDYDKDIKKPDAHAHLTQFNPEPSLAENSLQDKDLRRAGDRPPELRGRSRWNWRNLIPGTANDSDVSNPLMDASPNPRSAHSNELQVIADLSAIGLTPTAIVDDGCIIEATNARKAKGSIAMSQATSHRLSEPVTHLREALETNAEFKSDLRAFTRQYQNRLNAISNDREAIRTKLESEAGRAYLLCDAALNG